MGARRMLRLIAPILLAGPGCSLGPKGFRSQDLTNPAPLVRARAVSLGDQLPTGAVVPALLERLDDADPVVRLAAHEELRKRTGQDFGYRPWDDRAERASAIARWRAWWSGQDPGPVQPSPQQPPPTRRRRRLVQARRLFP